MCGIVAALGVTPVLNNLLTGLERLEYRGYDSCGVCILDESAHDLKINKTVKRVADLKAQTSMYSAAKVGIAHTRWATHGIPCEENAHPHVSEKIFGGKLEVFSVVHNGIIENYEELKDSLIIKGFKFVSETDTEVIAHLVASEYAGDLCAAVEKVCHQLRGSYAIAVMTTAEPGTLVGARLGSPLLLGKSGYNYYLASDSLALTGTVSEITYLEDGDLVKISNGKYFVCSQFLVNDVTIERPFITLEDTCIENSLGSYSHYMQKEIFEQPASIANCISPISDFSSDVFGKGAESLFKKVDSILILACGTSYYSGCVAKYWLESIAGVEVSVEVASEYRYRHPLAKKNCLVLVISQSGETADTLAALRHAKSLGMTDTLSICNVATSSMVRECALKFITNAGPEVGVASTKAFTTQLAALYALTLVLHNVKNPAKSQLAAGQDSLSYFKNVPSFVNQVLQLEPQIKQWAQKLASYKSALFLGRGDQYPVAQEGALKLKEISYIHAEAYSAGELKHGPLALICEEMPVIVLAPNNELIDKLNSNIQEVHARKGQLFILADSNTHLNQITGTNVIQMPTLPGPLATITYAVALQLLAYHVANYLGNDVDKPRNLAKSVTVE